MKIPVHRIHKDLVWGNGDPTAEYIGGKAMSLYTMSKLGLPVPPAIVIPCAATTQYKADPEGTLKDVRESISKDADHDFLHWISEAVGRPCLYSVRSGAPVSMPGMMDTILNVGLNDDTMPTFTKLLGQRVAWDSYRRLFQMFGTVVLEYDAGDFEKIIDGFRKVYKIKTDAEMPWEGWKGCIDKWCKLSAELKAIRSMSVIDQVMACVGAVFRSWDSERAIEYRKINGIADDMGTAVTIQAMVYGNMNAKSGSGVLFTREPSTGEKKILAECLMNAQGEDVVAGTHTPDRMILNDEMKQAEIWHYNLLQIAKDLEGHFRDMMDVEFTVEDGKLWILQCRRGKRTPRAALKIATDLLREGVITAGDLPTYVKSADVCKAAGKVITDNGQAKLIGKGLAAGGGVAAGEPVISVEAAVAKAAAGQSVVLVRPETTPGDIKGMAASVAIVTEKGGATSHAAVVSRAMNKACVTSVEGLKGFSPLNGWVVVNGDTGEVWHDPGKTMKIDDGGEQLVEELAAELVKGSGQRLLTTRRDLGVPITISVADLMYHPVSAEAALHGVGGSIVVDATNPKSMFHADDSEMWDLLAPFTVDSLHAEAAPLLVKKMQKTTEDLTVVGPAGSFGSKVKQVREAKTVADLLSGDPVLLTAAFVDGVVGGSVAMVKLTDKIGKVNLFTSAVSPYSVVMAACTMSVKLPSVG